MTFGLGAWAQSSVGFDAEMLRQRGIDPQIGDYFKDAARFRPGVTRVTLLVNGLPRGRVHARFDEQGQLCFDHALLEQARLRQPPQLLTPANSTGTGAKVVTTAIAPEQAGPGCYDFMAAYPHTNVELHPGQEQVVLVVPTDALLPNEWVRPNVERGGTAALANYEITASRNQFGQTSSQFLNATTELGFNTADWVIRTRQNYARQNGSAQRQHLYAYAQYALPEHDSIFQAGQISPAGNGIGTGPITGIQVIPENALMRASVNNVMVQGIAQSQARVEVRQSSLLIYSTVVPSGPFSLADLPLLDSTTDLDVTITESNGMQRRFTVAAASLVARNAGQVRGYALALGRQRALGGASSQPWLATLSGGGPLGRNSAVSGGLLVATGYQALSWSLATQLSGMSLNLQQQLSHLPLQGLRGSQASLSASSSIAQKVSLVFSTTRQTPYYRQLGEAASATASAPPEGSTTLPPGPIPRPQAQYSTTLGWSNALLGALSMSYSRASLAGGASSQRATAAWSRSIGQSTLSLSLERQLGGISGPAGQGGAGPTLFFLNISLPLGTASTRSYVNNSGGRRRMGLAYSDRLGDRGNYALAADRDRSSGDTSLGGQLNLLPRYTQFGLGLGRTSSSSSTTGSLRGGMVAYREGLVLSPYPVEDTFGVLQIADISGVQVNTPTGPVWTDWKGQAVVAQLQAYNETRLEVSTRSLPRNVDMRNGIQTLAVGRGAFSEITFQALRVQRLVLLARDVQGQALASSAIVLDGDQQFVTTVADNGQVFLLNGAPKPPLRVMLPDGRSCTLHYSAPQQAASVKFYDTVEASCRLDLKSPSQETPHALPAIPAPP